MKAHILAQALAVLAASGPLRADADLSKEQKECISKNVVAFGVSVTMATPTLIPGYKGIVAGAEAYGKRFGDRDFPNLKFDSPLNNYESQEYGKSPVAYLL